mgnify:CR=1 FL=1
MRVLIVEDDALLSDGLQAGLRLSGFSPEAVSCCDDARHALLSEGFEAMVLDLMLPDGSGLDLLRRLRAEGSSLPVLMLTARTDDMDQVLGLEMGADDYVAKPVKPRVLLARIRALLRRVETDSERDSSPARLEFGALVIDNSAREVTLAGESVDLTSAEYDLLWLLASNAGTVLSRETIFEKLRGIQYDGQDRSIDVRISRIRPKVGDDPENPKRIKTVRSKGYLFVKEIGAA